MDSVKDMLIDVIKSPQKITLNNILWSLEENDNII